VKADDIETITLSTIQRTTDLLMKADARLRRLANEEASKCKGIRRKNLGGSRGEKNDFKL